MKRAETHVVLIRGIGPESHKLLTMKELETLVAGLGDVRSVLATGNFVVKSSKSADAIAKTFVNAMAKNGLTRPLVMRGLDQLQALVAAEPMAEAVAKRPSKVLAHFLERVASDEAVVALRTRVQSETICIAAGELLIDYADGVASSKLTSGFIERCTGCMGTARNWNTVLKIIAAAE